MGVLLVQVTFRAEIGEGPLWLKIEADTERYTFSYAEVEGRWKSLGTGLTRLISSEVADVWSGILFGMYSTGNGKPCANPADFDWFNYHPVRLPTT